MASISTSRGGAYIIQFIAACGQRKTVWLGKVGVAFAREVARHVEALNNEKLSGRPIVRETAEWLGRIPDKLHKKLSAKGVGLIEPRIAIRGERLSEYLADYVAKRPGKERTVINRKAGAAKLTAFFKDNPFLSSITAGHADDWHAWLKKKEYAAATVSRAVKYAKEFFRYAMRRKLIDVNPFADLKAPSQRNENRKFMVSLADAAKIIEACPDAEWRLIVALSRFGGLRCPSETFVLTWDDVQWDRGRLIVRSPKTGMREVPIFPELRPYLVACYRAEVNGAVHVIAKHRNVSLRTRMVKIIKRAGVKVYPKPFHNLRASRQTELAAVFPLHCVCTWLGNTTDVAMAHYLKTTDADFDRASGNAMQIAMHQTATNRYKR
jgi:integrase